VVTRLQNGAGWQVTFDASSSKAAGLAGSPAATVTMTLQDAPVAGQRYDIADPAEGVAFQGTAWSAVGTVNGLGGDTLSVTNGKGRGWIRFDTAPAKAGDPAKGTFQIVFEGDCAPRDATLTLAGSFDATARDATFAPPTAGGIDSPEFRAWKCGLFDLFLLSLTITGMDGAVSLSLDGAPVASDTTPLNSAKYAWEDDKLNISFYGSDTNLDLSVEHPVAGRNLVTVGSLIPGGDCYYDVKSGEVDLPTFGGGDTDRWLTGSFDVTFTKASWAQGNCPDRHATGQFGAPVCR
jgi:hypothetical protein